MCREAAAKKPIPGRTLSALPVEGLPDDLRRSCDGRVYRQFRRVEQVRVGRLREGGVGPALVARVAGADVCQHPLERRA